jgi:hypothetical protein
MGPQSRGSHNLVILIFVFESPETKCHLDVGLVERHIISYKGEGDGLPQVQAMVSLVNSKFPMIHLSTKNAQTMH